LFRAGGRAVTRRYTGTFSPVDGIPDAWRGELIDVFDQWAIHLTIVLKPDGTLAMRGVLGDPPPDMWDQIIDGERA
jgi:hypothetical protein